MYERNIIPSIFTKTITHKKRYNQLIHPIIYEFGPPPSDDLSRPANHAPTTMTPITCPSSPVYPEMLINGCPLVSPPYITVLEQRSYNYRALIGQLTDACTIDIGKGTLSNIYACTTYNVRIIFLHYLCMSVCACVRAYVHACV